MNRRRGHDGRLGRCVSWRADSSMAMNDKRRQVVIKAVFICYADKVRLSECDADMAMSQYEAFIATK